MFKAKGLVKGWMHSKKNAFRNYFFPITTSLVSVQKQSQNRKDNLKMLYAKFMIIIHNAVPIGAPSDRLHRRKNPYHFTFSTPNFCAIPGIFATNCVIPPPQVMRGRDWNSISDLGFELYLHFSWTRGGQKTKPFFATAENFVALIIIGHEFCFSKWFIWNLNVTTICKIPYIGLTQIDGCSVNKQIMHSKFHVFWEFVPTSSFFTINRLMQV